jgi:hypothetical protein
MEKNHSKRKHSVVAQLTKTKVAEARQVVEIPPINPIVTEHQAISCRCANYGKQVRANLPIELMSSAFGHKIKK